MVLTISCYSEVQNLVEFFFIGFLCYIHAKSPHRSFLFSVLLYKSVNTKRENFEFTILGFCVYNSSESADRQFFKNGVQVFWVLQTAFCSVYKLLRSLHGQKNSSQSIFRMFYDAHDAFQKFQFFINSKTLLFVCIVDARIVPGSRVPIFTAFQVSLEFQFSDFAPGCVFATIQAKKTSPKKGADFNSQSKVICRILCWRPVGEI